MCRKYFFFYSLFKQFLFWRFSKSYNLPRRTFWPMTFLQIAFDVTCTNKVVSVFFFPSGNFWIEVFLYYFFNSILHSVWVIRNLLLKSNCHSTETAFKTRRHLSNTTTFVTEMENAWTNSDSLITPVWHELRKASGTHCTYLWLPVISRHLLT